MLSWGKLTMTSPKQPAEASVATLKSTEASGLRRHRCTGRAPLTKNKDAKDPVLISGEVIDFVHVAWILSGLALASASAQSIRFEQNDSLFFIVPEALNPLTEVAASDSSGESAAFLSILC